MQDGKASEDDIISAKCKYQKLSQEYADFCKTMNLPEERNRIYSDGLGKVDVKLPKVKKQVASSGNGDIIREQGKNTVNADQAHIENMVQRYRRLSEGSLDPDNIAKYRAKLSEWENRLNEFGNNEFNAKNEQISVENVKNPDVLFERIPKHNYDKNINSDNVFLHNENVGEKAGSELFAEQERENLYQSERIISGNKYETAIVYDETGKVMFRRKGSYGAESFTKAQLPKLKGKIITHNHPSSSGLSADDIIFMQKNSLAEIRSCNIFGTHIMRPTKKSLAVSF